MLRERRPDLRDRVLPPHPLPAAASCSCSCPGGEQIVQGLLGADLVGFQRPAAPRTSLAPAPTVGSTRRRRRRASPTSGRRAAAARARGAFPISIDIGGVRGRSPRTAGGPGRGAGDPRRSSATPSTCCSASTGSTTPRASTYASRPSASCSPTARSSRRGCSCRSRRPSRENVEHYQQLRDEIELLVGRDQRRLRPRSAHPAIHYLHQPLPARGAGRLSTRPPTSCSSRRSATA